jgi:hypothetical protein
MLGYQSVDTDYHGLGMAKSILRGVADDRSKLQVISSRSNLAVILSSGQVVRSITVLQDSLRSKDPSRRGAALFTRGRAPLHSIQLGVGCRKVARRGLVWLKSVIASSSIDRLPLRRWWETCEKRAFAPSTLGQETRVERPRELVGRARLCFRS